MAGNHRRAYSPNRTVTYFAGAGVLVVALALIDKGERSDISAADRNALKKISRHLHPTILLM